MIYYDVLLNYNFHKWKYLTFYTHINPLTVAQSKIDSAKQKESQALASYEEYCSQADAAYGAYYGKINTQTETNEKNAEQIEESKYKYE